MGKLFIWLMAGFCLTQVIYAQEYTEVQTFTSNGYYTGVVSADFNNDGLNDIALSNFHGEVIEIFLNKGGGTFATTPDHTYDPGSAPGKMVGGLFDAGSTVDIVALLDSDNTIAALLSNGDGTFTTGPMATATSEDAPTYISSFQQAPGDMYTVVLGNKFAGTITLYSPNGDGSFGAPVVVESAYNAQRIGAGDLDNDGDIDLAVGNGSNGNMTFHLNDGNGDFSATQDFPVVNASGHESFIADFNGDNITDMAVVLHNYDVNSLRMFHGKFGGGFEEVQVLDGGYYPRTGDMIDLDGANGPDIVTTDADGVYFWMNDGNGMLSLADSIPLTGFEPRALVVSKLNSDRYYDFVIASTHGARVYLSSPPNGTSNIPQAVSGISLDQNYPNPVRERTTIAFELREHSAASIALYSIDGKRIRTISAGTYTPGRHEVTATLTGLPAGNYYYRLESNGKSVQRMLTVVE